MQQNIALSLQRQLEQRSGRPVDLCETHISWVLLDGELAYKLKKPLDLGFVDFTDLDRRRRLCEEEVRLNRRLAPDLYLGTVPIVGTADAPRIALEDEASRQPPIDHAVKMRRFPDDALLVDRLAADCVRPEQIEAFGHRIAAFHAAAAPGAPHAGDAWGQVLGTLERLEALVGTQPCTGVRAWLEAQVDALAPVWARRAEQGRVRECHGDLHLSNVVVLGEELMAFDCIEFDPALRWIDVMSDVGFFVMDLLAHDRRDLAFRFLDAWLQDSGDYEGLAVLRFYMVYRALVRALVRCLRPPGPTAAGPDYLALAGRLVIGADPRLMITHGLSGSGKSFAAQRLLEEAGAIRIRSDVERKRLFGLAPLAHSGARAGEVYAAQASERTYARLLELARLSLAAGFPTIVDAAFLRRRERRQFQATALQDGWPFAILECHAPPELLRERVRERMTRGGDPSEADLDVLERQFGHDEALEPDELAAAIRLDAGGEVPTAELAARWHAIKPAR